MTYADRTVEVDEIGDSVRREFEWRENSLVTGDLVYAVIYDVDPDALAQRLLNLRRRTAKGNFTCTSRGPNWVHALDGHNKLMGYENSTLPIAVYRCIGTCSRKMLWPKVWVYLQQERYSEQALLGWIKDQKQE